MMEPHAMAILIYAIMMVESGGNMHVGPGDGGRAIGPFQIHEAYLQDSGRPYQHREMQDPHKAIDVIDAYMRRYATPERKPDGMTWEEFVARIHNGGPRGHERDSTLGYWARVKKVLSDLD